MKEFFVISLMVIGISIPASGLEIAKPEGELKKLPRVYSDKGACPFECCIYREWTVVKEMKLFDKPHGSIVVARIRKGEKVMGLTGEVEIRPVVVNVHHDHLDSYGNKFGAGEKFFLLTYRGEGQFKAWGSGKFFFVDEAGIDNIRREKSTGDGWARAQRRYSQTWWKKVRSASGIEGWTTEDGFFGVDGCG